MATSATTTQGIDQVGTQSLNIYKGSAQKGPSQSELIWTEQQKLNQAIYSTLNEVMKDNAVQNLPHILEQAEILKQYHLTYKSLSSHVLQTNFLFIALKQNNIQNKHLLRTIEKMINRLLKKQTRVPSRLQCE